MSYLNKNQLIIDVLRNRRRSTDIAVIYEETRLSYKELYEKVETLGNNIIGKIKNLEKPVHNIALFIDNSIDYIMGYFIIQYVGCTVVPIDVNVTRLELENILDFCDVHIVITNNEYEEYIANLESPVTLININRYDNLCNTHDLETINDIFPVSYEDTAILIQTSGTTGAPKFVMLSHENILSNAAAIIEHLGINSKDKTLIVLPLRLSCNTSQMITHMLVGGTVVIHKGDFSAQQVIDEIIYHGITNTSMVPPMLYLLQTVSIKKFNQITAMRFICYSGCKTNNKVIEKLSNKLSNVDLIETYGLTEAGPRVCNIFPFEKTNHKNAVGQPMHSVQVKIIENSHQLAANTLGEIIVKSKGVMKGYYKNISATENCLKDGWLYTGDIGYLDSENYLYIIGRKKNIINCGGNKLSPEEVESVLLELDFICEVYVYSEQHEILCEIPIADVIFFENTHIEQKLQSIQQHCKERLSKYKIPRKINIVKEIMHNKNGKIVRHQNKTRNN